MNIRQLKIFEYLRFHGIALIASNAYADIDHFDEINRRNIIICLLEDGFDFNDNLILQQELKLVARTRIELISVLKKYNEDYRHDDEIIEDFYACFLKNAKRFINRIIKTTFQM